MSLEEVLPQSEGSEDEIDVLLIGVIESIERVVASRFCGMCRIENRASPVTALPRRCAGGDRSRNSRSPLPSKMIIGILRSPNRRVRSWAMMFSRNVDLPAPVPPTMTPCFIRTASGHSQGSLWTLYPSKVDASRLADRAMLPSACEETKSGGCGQFSSRLRFLPASCAITSPPPKKTTAKSMKSSRHWELCRCNRETPTYQQNARTAHPKRTRMPVTSSGPC